jgi:hypothetical protein
LQLPPAQLLFSLELLETDLLLLLPPAQLLFSLELLETDLLLLLPPAQLLSIELSLGVPL